VEKKENKMHLPKVDDLFTTQYERDLQEKEHIINVSVSEIDEFPNHPFKVIENEELKELCDSITQKGILVPAIVRKKSNGRYEMVSGHRRKRACELSNINEIPAIIRDLTDEEATIIMVDSNLQREKILPSEKAFAYKMKLEALNHQGKRNDLTSCQVGIKLSSAKEIGKEFGDSERHVYRYIRLTYLIPEIIEYVDNSVIKDKDKLSIALSPAVELSYLTKEEQENLLDYMEFNGITPSHSQAIELKEMSQNKTLTVEKMEYLLDEEKPNQIPKMKFSETRIRNVLPRNIKEEKIEDFVVKSIEFYTKHLRQKAMNEKMNER